MTFSLHPQVSSFFSGKVETLQLDPSAFLADSELLRALEQHATALVCEEDRVLFRQGDPPDGVYLLLDGTAAVTMDSGHGTTVFTCQAKPGSLLGLPALVGKQSYSLSATARPGAKVKYVAKDEFDTLMQSELALMVKVLQVLAAEVRSARMAITQSRDK
jgi:CRP/FNR family cyclic AMP-dependent transcriptional regulator